MSAATAEIQLPGYEIMRPLGKGGMATVYLAMQINLHREVAIKIMATHLAEQDESFGDRFLREARISGSLKHPHIVGVHDVGIAGKYHYIAMEYHSGGVLKDRLREGVTVSDALRITREIASALDYAHGEGFIHRDIKPDNILFRSDGGAVLMDFGIARAVNSDTQMTVAGAVVGTPHYMSPEQAMGNDLDHRSDIYSLGVMLFEMLTGRRPFVAESPLAVCMLHVTDPPPPLPDHLQPLQPLVSALLAKDRNDRIQSGGELADIIVQIEKQLGESDSGISVSAAASRVLDQVSDSSTKLSATLKGASVETSDFEATRLATSNDEIDATVLADTADGQGPRSRLPALAAGLALVAAVGGAAAWYLSRGAVEVTAPVAVAPATEPAVSETAGSEGAAQLTSLLAQIKQSLLAAPQAGPETSPTWALIEEARSLAPDDPTVGALADQLAVAYAAQASAALAAGDQAQAEAQIGYLETIAPDHPQLANLQAALADAQARRSRAERMDGLLRSAEQRLNADQLTSPAGASAMDAIAAAAALQPEDPRIAALRQRVAQRYVAIASGQRARNDFAGARASLSRAEEIVPGLAAIATERAALARLESGRLAAQRAAQERAARLTQLLDAADAALAAGRLAEPTTGNAYALYRQALAIDPQNPRAASGLGNVRERYLAAIEERAKAGDLLGALARLGNAAKLGISEAATAAIEQKLAGQILREQLASGGEGPTMVFVPAGRFRIGDSAGTGFPSERPVQLVAVERPFMMASYEVTFEEFDRFAAAVGIRPPKSDFGRGRLPVTGVTWRDAKRYTEWLSKETGAVYRLPSEREWEYAARANTSTEFWWGSAIGNGRANCKNCGGRTGRAPLPVGSFEANGFGLYDTVGNVYEWTRSLYTNGYQSDAGDVPYRPGSGNPVARGGSWYDTDRFNRASMRLSLKPDFKSNFLGFRVVRDL